MHSVVLGGGCFWCVEAAYQLIKGVDKVVSGYTGGNDKNPTYEAVCTGQTGHAEVVKVTFDPGSISLENILRIFWTVHDPTTLNQQGADIGTQYRSCIFYEDSSDLPVIKKSMEEATALWQKPLTTTAEPLGVFYAAEDYHQDYFANHPEAGYCQIVIHPKLTILRKQLAHLLR